MDFVLASDCYWGRPLRSGLSDAKWVLSICSTGSHERYGDPPSPALPKSQSLSLRPSGAVCSTRTTVGKLSLLFINRFLLSLWRRVRESHRGPSC